MAVAPKAADLLVIKSALISNERVQVPAWLEVDIEKLQVVYLLFRSAIKSIWTFASSSSSNFTRNNRGIVRRLIPHDRVHEPTVTTEEVNDTVARFIVEPLERGYGYTLGNCMRRVLLSSLDGAKATAIQIEGVQHEFTTAEGVIEDITDIVLNVKGLVFSALNDDIEEATAHVSAGGSLAR